MLARRVKWKNSFRDFEGTVVKVVKDECTVFEFNDMEEYSVAKRHLTLCQPDCCRYASYLRKKFEPQVSDTADDDSVHEKVISALESLHGDSTFLKSKQDAIEHEIRLKGAAARVYISSESDNKFASKFSPSANPPTKSDGNGKIGAADSHSDDESNEEEEDEEDNDSNEESSGESEGSGDESAESSSEEADTSDTGSDGDNDSDGESDGEDEDDEDEKVDIKIYILPNNDIRGFSVRLTDRGLQTIRKALKKDYGAAPHMFFRDSDGDVVAVKSAHDLRYAHRATKAQQNNEGMLKVKLFAEVENTVLPVRLQEAATTSSPSMSVDSLSPTVRFVDQGRVADTGLGASHTSTVSRSGQQSPSLGATARGSESLRLDDDALQTSTEAGVGTPSRGTALNFEVLWKRGELLGAGSFGKVYSGLNLSTGERMAVKEVALRRSKKHKQQVQALQLEVKILSSLEHPNIIKYFGTEFTKHTLRIFLELANDGTVKDALNEFGAFPEPLVRRYASDILEGLWFLHSKKFIHRDIKPTNLLVSGGRVKLGDFGCSTTILEDENTLEAGHCTMAGTAVYMAPEVMQVGEDFDIQAITSQQQGSHSNNPSVAGVDTLHLKKGLGRRRRGYGKRADVWSVGITLCEMATAKAPFPNAGAAIYAVCVSKKFPSFPEVFSAEAHLFLERCLMEDAKVRATCTELRLMPFMNQQSVEEARAQTAAMLPRNAHTASHVTVHLQAADFSFLKSPSAADEADQSYHDTLRAAGNFFEKNAASGGVDSDPWGSGYRGNADHKRDRDAQQSSDAFKTAELQRDLFQSSFRSGDIFDRYERDRVRVRGREGDGPGAGLTGAASDASSRWSGSDMDMFRTAASEGPDHRYFSARSVSQEEDMFERGINAHHIDHIHVTTHAEAKDDAFHRTGTIAKECEEDADCKTGHSTSNSVVGNCRTRW